MATVLTRPQPTRTIPTIEGLPFFGHLFDFRADRLGLMERVARSCGDIGAFPVGPLSIVLVNSAELAQQVYVEQAANFEKSPFMRTYLAPLLGNGLVLSENDFHKRQRKLVAPAFQPKRIATYGACMADYAERIQREWADGATLDVAREMSRLTLWIAGKVLFDADVLDDAGDVNQALTVTMRTAMQQITALIRPPLTWPTPRNLRARAAIARIDSVVYRMIAERRASGEDKGDLLSTLLRARDEDDGAFMTDQQVRDEVMTLFMAGHETTANALAWTWYLLSQHPDIYARLRAEVDAVLAGRPPTVADLPNLPYTLQVFKEGLRLYPPVPSMGRQAVRPLDLAGYALPKGQVVIISPWTMHRRPDYFPEPLAFDPDRFTPENEARLPRHAYIPFGGGPRICIGDRFALMEGHLLLAALTQRVTFTLAPNHPVVPDPLITLRPRHGIAMRVQRRPVAGSW